MQADRWQQIERFFHAALERAPHERAAYLTQVCAGDDELRREVESLLAAHFEVGSTIERAASDLASEWLEQQRPPAKQTISHFRILSLLGKGGMGEVWLGEDIDLHRKVAVKLLINELTTDAERMRRFEREARAASALNHPNIITIYEIGQEDEQRFIVTEFVDGETLRQRISGTPIELRWALDAAMQVASALSVAHEAGIIHRDIKPENIMVRPDGLVKVLDFGLAKLATQQPETSIDPACAITISTTPGTVMGTVRYMSPEQARGLDVDARTDIFSMGVVLYEMITGQAPFEGATASDVIAAILKTEPPPLDHCRLEAPSELGQIINKTLSKDRAQRYQTIKELHLDLKALKQRLETEDKSEAAQAQGVKTGGREENADFASFTQPPKRQATAKRAMPRSRVILKFLLPAIALTALVFYGLLVREKRPALASPITSLVVLPLENLSGDLAQEYFVDGITDALTGELAKVGALHVISRTSAMHYKGTKKALPEIARELKVDAAVCGSVVRSGGRVRVRAQLIHAATDGHLWAETYERDLRDVLSLQSEIASAIARQIQVRITSAEQARLASVRPVNRKALDDYLQGRYHKNKMTKEHLHQAIEYFQNAIGEDPTYAPAYVGLAECYNALSTVMVGGLQPTVARIRAAEAAQKALAIDSELAAAHAALAYVKHYNWEWAEAEREFKRAIDLNANYAIARANLALYLSTRGRVEEALAEVSQARQIDPLSLPIRWTAGLILYEGRRYDEAIEHFRRMIEIAPDFHHAYWTLGYTYLANGMVDEAIAITEIGTRLSKRDQSLLTALGRTYGLTGRRPEAHKVLHELAELAKREYVPPAAFVDIHLGLGNKDQAFAWLEKAHQERSNYIAHLKVLPEVDPLRSDPRFDEMLRRIGLEP
jgi:eukaryotic-like serine/threonine-protein kinase